MSRVIKFRAWDVGNSVMVNSDYNDDHYILSMQQGSPELLEYAGDDFARYVEIESVIEQFTGLKDKNGFEIYEGDILCSSDEKYKGVVFYQDSNAKFLVDVFLNGKAVCRNEVAEFMSKRERAIKSECVVIGNIHQTPELIKGKTK